LSKYVILGNGIAGVSAARKIKEKDPGGRIEIVTRESYAFYSRPMLPRVIGGDAKEEQIIVYGADWFKKNDISMVLNEDVVEIDPGKMEAKCAGGKVLSGDRMLIAMGSYSFVPPIKGATMAGVFTLRWLDEALRIREYARKSKTAVIVGAGVLGLEVAAALTKYGVKVSVIEAAPRMLPRQLDPAGADILKKQLEEKTGFKFYLDKQVAEIKGDGKASEVQLGGGESLPADLVLISAGVRPNVAVASKAGLKVNKGIVVNDRMETNLKNVFAAGDVAEHNGILYGIIPAAQRQGEVAGINMAGGSELYQGTTPSNSVNVLGISLVSSGEIDAESKQQSLVKEDKSKGSYRKLVLKDDTIIGCVLLNDVRGSAELTQAISGKKNIGAYKEMLLDETFDYKRLA